MLKHRLLAELRNSYDTDNNISEMEIIKQVVISVLNRRQL